MSISVGELWEVFGDVRGWKRWNPCIRTACVREGSLAAGTTLVWTFNPIKRWYLYVMPARARIVEYDHQRRITWEVKFPGFHALHSYLFDERADGTARFGSWETAEGPLYNLFHRFWLAHFRFVRDASLAGARTLTTRRVRLVPSPPPERHEGDRPHRPLVVIPGIDGQRGSVAPLVELLSAQRQVLLVDYADEASGTIEELATHIGHLLPEKCDLVGQSVGTWLATLVANEFDANVGQVVLVSTFLRTRRLSLRVSALATRVTPRLLYRLLTPWLMALVCGPVGDGRHHQFLSGVADSSQEGVAVRTMWQVGREFMPELRALSKPVLVIMGEADRFIPDRPLQFSELRAIFERHQDRMVTLPQAGHVLLPTKAIVSAVREIEEFLE